LAQLGNLLVKGSSRFLNKAYFEDVYICGDVSTGGKLDITANEGKSILSLNGKKALEVYDTWLNINESGDFAAGIYCGSGVLCTDGEFQVSNKKTGVKFKVNNSSLASHVPSTFSAQATFNGGLIASYANISEEICNTLIVKDEFRSAKWNIDNITNLGSTFYVSPCIVFTNPSVYVNSISGTTVVLTITDNSITSSTIGGATWTNGSKVKLMGRIGNSALGTINGVLKRDLNSSTAKTAYISLDFPNTDLIKFSAGATYSGSNVGDLKMMMYEVNKNVNGTTKNRPIGILLSSYGENKKPCIDIYNGDIEDGSPVARMGYLNGLPSVNGVSPTGYGFYAAGNAYFSGTLVSSFGKIGGFEISQYKMVNDSGNGNVIGICSTRGQELAIWAGASKGVNAPFHVGHNGYLYASNANISGVITATSGKIGKYTITNNFLITGNNSTCTGMGGNQAFWAGSDSSNNAPFHVSYDGSLYASKANISGVINSTDGSIGGWKISSNKLSAFKNGTHHDSSTGEDYDAEYYISLLSGKDEIPTIITSYEYYPPDEDWKYETIISPTEITCKESYAPPDSSDMGVCNSTVYSSNGITFYNGVKIDGLTKVLWEGADYMNGAQTALLDEKVLDQLNGIALVWSHYNISTHQASNSDVHVQFISKWCVGEMNGAGHAFIDPYRHIDKYFYVYNDKIVGSNINGTSGTEGGLSYDNRNCVLRAVIGV